MGVHDVFASKGGRRYHSHQHCPAFRMGHDLWEFKADEWVPGMSVTYLTSGHHLELIDITEAAERELLRCTRCRPIPTCSEPEDFGHIPIISFIDGRALTKVCARCHPAVTGIVHAVRWPCASAVVLGLTPTT